MDCICVMCDELRDEDYGKETSIGFVCYNDDCIIDSRTEIDDKVASLESRLKEAEAIIKELMLERGYVRAAAFLAGGE